MKMCDASLWHARGRRRGGVLSIACVAAVISAACGAVHPVAVTPQCAPTLRASIATGVVELPLAHRASAGPSSDTDQELSAQGTARYEIATILAAASAQTGSRIDGVTIVRRMREVTVSVPGDSPQATLARCNAVLRAVVAVATPATSQEIEWLHTERDRTLRELAELRESLRRVDTLADAVFQLPDNARVATMIVESELRTLDEAGVRDGSALPEGVPPDLVLRAHDLAEARVQRDQIASVHGAQSLQLIAANARTDALERLYTQQRLAEQAVLRAVISSLHAIDARSRTPGVTAAALAAMLAHLDSEAVRSDQIVATRAPTHLRAMADELARERVEVAVLATRYGPNHPEMVVAVERLRGRAGAFEHERSETAATLRGVLAEVQGASNDALRRAVDAALQTRDPRQSAVARRREHLVEIVETLARTEAEFDDAHLRARVLSQCEIGAAPAAPTDRATATAR